MGQSGHLPGLGLISGSPSSKAVEVGVQGGGIPFVETLGAARPCPRPSENVTHQNLRDRINLSPPLTSAEIGG